MVPCRYRPEAKAFPVATHATLAGFPRHLVKEAMNKIVKDIATPVFFLIFRNPNTWRDGRWFCILIGSCLVSILVFDTGETTPPQFCEKCTPQCRNAQEIGYMGLVSAFNELHPEIAHAGLHVSWFRIDSLNCAGCAPREKPEGLHFMYPYPIDIDRLSCWC